MPTIRISSELIETAMRSKATREALRSRAQKLASRVDSIGASEGVQMDSRVTDGTRPKGRPYSRVESDEVGQEWGDRYSERKRIMGRAAEGS